MDPVEALASDDVTEDELVAIFVSTSASQRTRCAALNHPRMSSRRVGQIVAMGGTPAERALAMTMDTGVLEHWAASPDPYVRALCAFNPATPGSVLMELVGDIEPVVRVNAAMNGGLPRSERVQVALHDPEPAVREQVVWTMTTVGGRDILEGARYAVLRDDDGGEAPEEYRVLVYPLGMLGHGT